MRWLIFAAFVAAGCDPLLARDLGQWAQADDATRDWFRGLRNPNTHIPCCDFADGIKIDDPDYRENPDGSYEVFVRGMWGHVEKSQVINPPDRKVQWAIVWWAPGLDHPYCFMPGVSY